MPTKKQEFAFTQKRIEDLPAPKTGRTCVHDTKVPGLVVRVTAAGNKSYYTYRKLAGRPLRVRIGSTSELTVDQARTHAEELNGKIAKGIDPQAEKVKARQDAVAKGVTLQDLWDAYLELHAKPRKRTWTDDQRQYDKYLTPWHHRGLSSIQTNDVAKWHGRLAKDHGPIQANRSKALLATMFSKASLAVGYSGPNPCVGVANFPERSRERFLLPNEMKTFFDALSAEEEIWRDFFLTCLFTGSRRGNVGSMRWQEVDLANAMWHLPADKTKNKRPTVIALSPPVLAILQKRREQADNSEWVFPSGRTDGHVIDPRKAWDRIRGAMRQCSNCAELAGSKPKQCPKCDEPVTFKQNKCPRCGEGTAMPVACRKCHQKLPSPKTVNLRMHDLRRSLGSWQAALGASLVVIGKSLGHADLKSTQVYSRLQLDPIKDSVGKAADAMLAAGGQTKLLEAHSVTVEGGAEVD